MNLLLGCGLVMFLIFAVVGGVAVWIFKQYEQAGRTVEKAMEGYEQVSAAHAFTPPVGQTTIGVDRWERMLNVRQATLAALDERTLRMLTTLIENPQELRSSADLISLPQIGARVMETNLAALRENQMSLQEYLFLTGVMVHNMIARQNSSAAVSYRDATNKLVAALRAQSEGHPGQNVRFDPDHFKQELEREYGAWTLDQPEVFARLAAQDRNEALGDVMLVLFAPAIQQELDPAPDAQAEPATQDAAAEGMSR